MEDCDVYRPERLEEVAEIVREAPASSVLARGLGRSYGDAALGGGGALIATDRLDHLIDFDPGTGLLHCEAAVSFAEILAIFLPRGFFFPVTPGTKFITVGGAIAADVHGKNHHRSGSLANALQDFTLLTANGESLLCSREQNAELFWATLGGMGLTGIVLEARIRLQPVPSAWMGVHYERAPDLDRLLVRMVEGDDDFAYSVAWIDCLASGAGLGRGVLARADHAPRVDLSPRHAQNPFALPSSWRPGLPFVLPNGVLGRPIMRAFNASVFQLQRSRQALVDCDRYFYPLDGVANWNRAYGRRGLFQYQFVLPFETARQGLVEVLERLVRLRLSSFICVLKTLGAESGGLLSFPRPGITLALDVPNAQDGVRAEIASLDEVVLRHGGRIYLAKDAVSSPEAIREMYPALDRFLEIKARVDPDGRFASAQSRRLGITQ